MALTMERKVKGAKTTSLAEFRVFDYERRQALLTMDEGVIRRFYAEWAISFPPGKESFWEAVAKNILLMKEVPPKYRMEALRILDELNIDYEAYI